MESKLLEKIENIFKLYAVPAHSNAVNKETELAHECNFILLPTQFAIGALREIGYYPSYNMLEYCRQKLSMSCKESYSFQQFVSLCQMIEEINQVQITRKAITNCLKFINIHNSNVVSRSEFCLLVFDGAEHLSTNERDAILDLLDPQNTSSISLSSLKKVLCYAHMFIASRVRKVHESSQHKMSSVASTSVEKNRKPDSSGAASYTCEERMHDVNLSKCVDKRAHTKLSQVHPVQKPVNEQQLLKEENLFHDEEEEEELLSISSPSFESSSRESHEDNERRNNDKTTSAQLVAGQTLVSNEIVTQKLNIMERSDGVDYNVTGTNSIHEKVIDKRPITNLESGKSQQKNCFVLKQGKDENKREGIWQISIDSTNTNIKDQSNTENVTVKQNNNTTRENQAEFFFCERNMNAENVTEVPVNNAQGNDNADATFKGHRHSITEFTRTRQENENSTKPLPYVSEHTSTLSHDKKEKGIQDEQNENNERATAKLKKSKSACCSVC